MQIDLAQLSLAGSPNPIAEEKLLLWSADGTFLDVTSTTGTASLQDGNGALVIGNGAGAFRIFTLSSSFSSSIQFALEVTMWASSGYTINAALADDSSATPYAPIGTVSTTATTATILRSAKITLTPGHSYKVLVWVSGSTCYFSDASLIVFP